MYLVINKCLTAVKVSNFSGHYLRNRSSLDIGVLGYIGIVQHKEHSPEVFHIPPGTPCITVLRVELEFKTSLFECRKISKNWQMWVLFLLPVVLYNLRCGQSMLNSVFQSCIKGYYFTLTEKKSVELFLRAFCSRTSVASTSYF